MSTSGTDGIREARAHFAPLFNAGKLDEVGEIYTEDAWMLPPACEPIRGRSDIVKFFREAQESMGLTFEIDIIDVAAEGPLGYVVGSYIARVNGQVIAGVTHETWCLQPDGTWKAAVDMWHPKTA
jgi:ketosteroid isomerase-like protein